MKFAILQTRKLVNARPGHYGWLRLFALAEVTLCICVLFCMARAQTGAALAPVPVDNNDVRALLADARAKDSAGLKAEAVKLYRRAAAMETESVVAYRELAAVLARDQATYLEAEGIYKKLTAILPDDADLAIARAANFARAGESAKAVVHFLRASELAPNSEVALRGYIREVEKLGAVPVAIKQHTKMLATNSRNAVAQIRFAELLRSDGRYNEALSHYWIVQRLEPMNLIALRGIAESWFKLGYLSRAEESFRDAARHAKREISLTDSARLLLASGRPSAALKLLNQRAADLTKEPSSLLVLADASRETNDPNGERKALERLLAIKQTSDVEPLERLARVAYETGDRKTARAVCQRLVTLDERNAVAAVGLHLLGDRELSSVPPGGTVEHSQQTKREEPDQSSAMTSRRVSLDRAIGEAALFWNQPQLAKIYLQRAVVVWWRSPRLLSALAVAFRRSGNFEAAIAAYTSTDFKDGRSPDALLGWAETEMMRNNTRRALTIYRDVSRIDPTNLHASAGEAEALRREGSHAEAAVLFANLVKRAPEEERFNRGLTETLAELGRGWTGATPAAPLLGAGDTLRVQIRGELRFDGELRLDNAAKLRLPFMDGAVEARCLTENELAAAIAAQSRTPLEARDVSVQVVAFERAPLTVAGAVYLPNIFYVRAKLNLRQGLMLASGATKRAGDVVYVVRGASTCPCRSAGRIVARVDSYSRTSIEEESGSAPQPLLPGDTVFVPDVDAVFIHGEVPRPGSFVVNSGATLLQFVRSIGEPSNGADLNRVGLTRVQRRGGSRQKFIIDLKDIEQGRVGDVILLPGDVLEVPSRQNGVCARSFAAILNQIAANEATGTGQTRASEQKQESQ